MRADWPRCPICGNARLSKDTYCGGKSCSKKNKPELFQVTVVFGNFEDRKQAAEFRAALQNNEFDKLQINRFISGGIRGSWS